jgi:hypothetical protein
VKYPISPPGGIPSYVTESVQQQCDRALASVFSGETVERLRESYVRELESEVKSMRLAYAGSMTPGNGSSSTPWISWGYRTVTEALRHALTLAEFRDALASPRFSHVTHGHPVSPHAFHVYGQDISSPSGCKLVCSIGMDSPGAREILAASRHGTIAGGERGEMHR